MMNTKHQAHRSNLIDVSRINFFLSIRPDTDMLTPKKNVVLKHTCAYTILRKAIKFEVFVFF